MSYGYSARVVEINKGASEERLGVALGRLCIALDIPVVVVANTMGVSKQTVYNWFMGLYDPHPTCVDKVQDMLTSLQPK